MKKSKQYRVYILASKKQGPLYMGVTTNIKRRIAEHADKMSNGYTKKQGITVLVHCEEYGNSSDALRRVKQLKDWRKEWQVKIIEEKNPQWQDLSESGVGEN